jgi:intein/homing endonuclease
MERRRSVIKATTRMAENNPGEAEEIYKQGLEQLQEIDKRESSTSEVRNKVLSRIQATKMAEERRVSGGFEVLPGRMTNLTNILEGGSWRSRRLIIVGAIQNMGKSSFVDDLMWQIVSNPKNNAIGYWLTLDDSVEDRQRRLQTCATGSPNFSMNMISNPHYFAEECGISGVYETREASYAKLVEQVAAGRIIIEGSQDGTTVSYARKRVQQIRRENPDKNILLCIDNLHDLEDYPNLDTRTRITNIITSIKTRIVDSEKVTAICTAEYRKGDPEVPGTDEDLAECLTDDTKIINYDTGELEKIADIQVGTRVHTLDEETFKIVPRRITGKFDKGIQRCYRVHLRNGFYVEGTCNHPVFGEDGTWTKIKDLRPGDYITIPQNLHPEERGEEKLSPDICRLLGYLAGDGSYTQPKGQDWPATPRMTNSDEEIVRDIHEIVSKEFPNNEISMYPHNGSNEMRLRRKNGTPRHNEITQFLQRLGIYNQRSEKKTTPREIFISGEEARGNYLAGLFNTDGSVGLQTSSSPASLRFFTKSKSLAESVSHLLMTLGILSTITKPRQDDPKSVYVIYIPSEDRRKFLAKVPLRGRKRRLIDRLIKQSEIQNKKAKTYHYLPPHFSKTWHQSRIDEGKTIRVKTTQNPAGYQLVPGKKINLSTFSQFKMETEDIPTTLDKYASGDCLWQQIKEIEDIGDQHTWDLEIEDTHNFVANNIFCHNSRKLKFAAHLTIHLFSDCGTGRITPEEAVMVHNYGGKIRPRVIAMVGKNKITDFKGKKLYFDFHPESSMFLSVPREVALSEAKERKAYLNAVKSKGTPQDEEDNNE